MIIFSSQNAVRAGLDKKSSIFYPCDPSLPLSVSLSLDYQSSPVAVDWNKTMSMTSKRECLLASTPIILTPLLPTSSICIQSGSGKYMWRGDEERNWGCTVGEIRRAHMVSPPGSKPTHLPPIISVYAIYSVFWTSSHQTLLFCYKRLQTTNLTHINSSLFRIRIKILY